MWVSCALAFLVLACCDWLDGTAFVTNDHGEEVHFKRHLQGPPPLANYTSGFWRSDYIDESERGSFFVQADVLAIGVCYATANTTTVAPPTAAPSIQPTAAASNPEPSAIPSAVPTSLLSLLPLSVVYRKLVSVNEKRGRQSVTLRYAEYTDSACSNQVRTYIVNQRVRTTELTNNDVPLKVQRRFVTAFPPTLPGRYTVGYIISYFGADEKCFGNAYKLLAGTDRCSNYPTYFGRVRCNPKGEKLLFYTYPFDADGSCAGEGMKVKRQDFECSDQGTDTAPSYEVAVCLPV